MACFRQAERQVQQRYPALRAEALIVATRPTSPTWIERCLPACLALAHEGLAGIHIIPEPDEQEANWSVMYGWAERAASAGLGIAAHAGEFSSADMAGALQIPGLTRIGHAVYAASDAALLEQLARSGVTVECCLSCNVILGATPSYETHPIRQFVANGIPVTLATDDPIRIGTTIGREYAIAEQLGFTPAQLLACTQTAIHAAFTSSERREALLEKLDSYQTDPVTPTPLL